MITSKISCQDEIVRFTDDWAEGDIEMIMNSDYCFELIGSDKAMEELDLKIIHEPESVILWSDGGKPFCFSNVDLEDLISDYAKDYGRAERVSGLSGIYC